MAKKDERLRRLLCSGWECSRRGGKRHSTEMNGAVGTRYKHPDSFRVGWGSWISPARKLRAWLSQTEDAEPMQRCPLSQSRRLRLITGAAQGQEQTTSEQSRKRLITVPEGNPNINSVPDTGWYCGVFCHPRRNIYCVILPIYISVPFPMISEERGILFLSGVLPQYREQSWFQ